MSSLFPDSQGYQFHPAVNDDIEAIITHVLTDSFDGALRVLDRLAERFASLVPLAVRHQGHRRPDLTDRPLLFVSVFDYLIAYDPARDPMLIVGVLHGKREPRLLRQLLDERH